MVMYLYFIFVLAPIIFWFLFFFWEDRCDPGPKRMMFGIFILGMLMALLAGWLERGTALVISPTNPDFFTVSLQNGIITTSVLLALISGSIIEEILKFLTFRIFIYNRINFNQVADGVFYGVTMALGFSLVENTGYFLILSSFLPANIYFISITLRAIFTVLLHLTTAGILGYYFGRVKFGYSPKNRLWLALIWAIILHLSYNLTQILAFFLLIPSFIFLIYVMHRPENQLVWGVRNAEK